METEMTMGLKEICLDVETMFEYLNLHFEVVLKKQWHSPVNYVGCRIIDTWQDEYPLYSKYIYFIKASLYQTAPLNDEMGKTFLVLGDVADVALSGENIYFLLSDYEKRLELFTRLQEFFDRCHGWAGRLKSAFFENKSLYDICMLGVDFMKNPIMVHDENFIVLSAPKGNPRRENLEEDRNIGVYSIPVDLINYYKLAPEYLESLMTHGANIFDADPSGVNVLYCNLWDRTGNYRGRICVNEVNGRFYRYHFAALEYFEQIVRAYIRNTQIGPLKNYEYGTNSAMTAMLHKKPYKVSGITRFLERNQWRRHDPYLCIKLQLGKNLQDIRGVASLRSHIYNCIPRCFVLYIDNSVVIIVNVADNAQKNGGISTQLAEIIREGLYIAGISNKCFDFFEMSDYYRQAELAIEYGIAQDPMIWCHNFSDYLLTYMLDNSCGDIAPRNVCYSGILELIEYDKKYHKDLYMVLKIYLFNERNAKKTAEDLFMHRSTLFRKLDKIGEILNLDMEDYRQRLLLQNSILLLEQVTEKEII